LFNNRDLDLKVEFALFFCQVFASFCYVQGMRRVTLCLALQQLYT
jgi:hypothetical protein